MANMLDKEMRYGISALSTEHHMVAESDELLVHPQDGRMYYKRDDGQIVTAPVDYTRKALLADLVNSGITLNLASNQYICYNEADITGLTNLQSEDTVELQIKSAVFKVDDGRNGACLRIHGSDIINTVINYIRAMYEIWEGAAKVPDPEVYFTLVVNDKTEVQVPAKFNTLTHVDLGVEGPASFYVKSVSFPRIIKQFAYLNAGRKSNLAHINWDNDYFEASVVDIVTITSKVADVPVYLIDGKVYLKMLFPMEAVIEDNVTLGGGGIVISDTKPDYPCIWANTNPKYPKE